MLTDDAIRTLRATEMSRKLFDEKGLYLLVTPGGARLALSKQGQGLTVKSTLHRGLASVLQILGSAFLVTTVLTHVAESFSLLPRMCLDRPNTPVHYLDLVSAVAGLVLLVVGMSLRRFGGGNSTS